MLQINVCFDRPEHGGADADYYIIKKDIETYLS